MESDSSPAGSDLSTAVEHVRAAWAEDEAVRQEILAFCARHPDALHRSCLEGHLTGSALVVDPRTRQVLLIHHAKLERWLQPGGHADGDGNLGRVALREAEEETGLSDLRLVEPAVDLDIHRIPERGEEPAHLHLDVRYLVLAAGETTPTINHESLDVRWISGDDPDGLIESDELHRLIRRGFEKAEAVYQPRSPGAPHDGMPFVSAT